VTDTTVATDVLQTLDILLHFTAELTFELQVVGDIVQDTVDVLIIPVLYFSISYLYHLRSVSSWQ
jgi:hypothetical protein